MTFHQILSEFLDIWGKFSYQCTVFIFNRRSTQVGLIHRLNMELDLQSLFGLLCTLYSCTHWLRPTPPFSPYLGSYTRALLVSRDRRRLFANSYTMRKGFLIYEELRKCLVIWGGRCSNIWLCTRSFLNFLIHIWGKFLFFIRALCVCLFSKEHSSGSQ